MGFLHVGVRHRAVVGVGVHQQDVAQQRGRSKARLTATVVRPGAPFGPQTATRVCGVSWTGGGGVGRLRRAGCGLGGQGLAGQVDQGGRGVGVGADLLQAELAEAAFAVLVASGCDADHGQPGGGQPGEGVVVEPAGAGGDDGRFGLAGGRYGEQVAEVVAAVEDLGGHGSCLAGLALGPMPSGLPV
jgi:hypothetical protein